MRWSYSKRGRAEDCTAHLVCHNILSSTLVLLFSHCPTSEWWYDHSSSFPQVVSHRWTEDQVLGPIYIRGMCAWMYLNRGWWWKMTTSWSTPAFIRNLGFSATTRVRDWHSIFYWIHCNKDNICHQRPGLVVLSRWSFLFTLNYNGNSNVLQWQTVSRLLLFIRAVPGGLAGQDPLVLGVVHYKQ